MKYLKTFEAKKVIIPTDIKKICKEYNIDNYTINDDGSIDVDGNVNLSVSQSKLPLKFRNVSGDFDCSGGGLTTLEGCPQSVGGDFYCDKNQLTTLEGCPKSVGGYFDCSGNKLTTLEGCPQTVGGNFYCDKNQLTTLEGGPQSVGGDFYCIDNQLINFNGFPEDFEGDIYLSGNPVGEIYYLFGTVKCIRWINEFDVIQGDSVILDRLEEVYHELGMRMVSLKSYKIID